MVLLSLLHIILMCVLLFAARESLVAAGSDMTLWIDKKQIQEFGGFNMEIPVIADGVVMQYLKDPNLEANLPVIPTDVNSVNFTWKAGENKHYFYDFDQLHSYKQGVLHNPTISIARKGKVPSMPRVFQVFLPCTGNKTAVAGFSIGLQIQNERGKFLPGMPLRLRLSKQCVEHGPDTECDKKCANNGWCNSQKVCECKKGYMGQYCKTALCYPQCMNGGTCSSPGTCQCPPGYQGPYCEGGICAEKCLNGGKCVQKDTCKCRKGYYGPRCEYSKCTEIPCLNSGRCVGVNRCRCKKGFIGPQCQIINRNKKGLHRRKKCRRHCLHGTCNRLSQCICHEGWHSKNCSIQLYSKCGHWRAWQEISE